MAEAARRVLFVHAHPDDETIGTGATMARCVAEGAQVTLVTCTLGEEGEVLVDSLADLAASAEDRLGEHRLGELAAAMGELGVTDFRLLGGAGRYRDSGMMGLPTNDRLDCFWQALLDEAAGLLLEVVREVRPQVLVTYDERGGYGHPDHIQAHRVAMRAVELAEEAGFPIAKVYWTAFPESFMRDGLRALAAAGEASFFDGLDPEGDLSDFTTPDALVTTEVDGSKWGDAKMAAMRAHATQITVDGPFFALSNNLGNEVMGREFYRIVRGERGPGNGPDGWESDLFAGLTR